MASVAPTDRDTSRTVSDDTLSVACGNCGHAHRGIRLLPLRCRCGQAIDRIDGIAPPPPAAAPRRRRRRCVRLGDAIGTAQCHCRDAPSVYTCEVHALAMTRRVEHAPAGVAMLADGRTRFVRPRWCEMCPDHQPPE